MLRRQSAFVVSAEPRAVVPTHPTALEVCEWGRWLLNRVRLSVDGLEGDAWGPDARVPNKLPLSESDLETWASDPRTTDELQGELLITLPHDLKSVVFELSSTQALGYWLQSRDRVGAVRFLQDYGVLEMVVGLLEARGWVFKW